MEKGAEVHAKIRYWSPFEPVGKLANVLEAPNEKSDSTLNQMVTKMAYTENSKANGFSRHGKGHLAGVFELELSAALADLTLKLEVFRHTGFLNDAIPHFEDPQSKLQAADQKKLDLLK